MSSSTYSSSSCALLGSSVVFSGIAPSSLVRCLSNTCIGFDAAVTETYLTLTPTRALTSTRSSWWCSHVHPHLSSELLCCLDAQISFSLTCLSSVVSYYMAHTPILNWDWFRSVYHAYPTLNTLCVARNKCLVCP